MKRKFPTWSLLFCLLLISFFAYCRSLYTARDKNYTALNTVSGSPATLNGVTLTLNTWLSNYNDRLTTEITLGERLHSISAYKDGISSPDSATDLNDIYFSIRAKETPSVMPPERTVPYKTIAKTVPFTIRDRKGEYTDTYDFPYIHIDTPDDMTLTRTSYGGSDTTDSSVDNYNFSFNYDFSIYTSPSVQLKDTFYFTITGFTVSPNNDSNTKEIPYEIENGIFSMENGTLSKVYDYTTTQDNACQILSLISLNEKDRLGLIVKEGSNVLLKVINPVTKEMDYEFSLYEDTIEYTLNAPEYPPEVKSFYNSSSRTLVLTSTYEEVTIPLSDYNRLAQQYDVETEESKLKVLRDQLNASTKEHSRLLCFTLDDAYSLTKQMDLFGDSSKQEEPTVFSTRLSSFTDCKDYIYLNGTLVLVTEDYSNYYTPLPLLMAIKGDTILYEGYIETAANEDYACNRIPLAFHDSSYNSFTRRMTNFQLSVTK